MNGSSRDHGTVPIVSGDRFLTHRAIIMFGVVEHQLQLLVFSEREVLLVRKDDVVA